MIAWFCPSGSSVTMNVERFERETTSVWTFRFPCCVGFAFGIFAASSLTSAGARVLDDVGRLGSRKSIFATASGCYPGAAEFLPAGRLRFLVSGR